MVNIQLLLILFFIAIIIAGVVSVIFLNIQLRSLLKPVYKKKVVAYWLLLSVSFILVIILLLFLEGFVFEFGYYSSNIYTMINITSFLITVLYALLIGYLAAKKIKKYIELSNKSNLASTDIDQRSMIQGEKPQDLSTVKLETKPGRANKKGYDPKSAKKKVSVAVWLVSLLGLVLAIVLVQQKVKPSDFGILIDDRDGKSYKTIQIGNQVWMAENLNYNAGSGSWCYDDKASNCNTYGRLYNWETALNACPRGWRLPTDAEWTQLTDYVGSSAGRKLKARSGWHDDGNGNDDYGFSALPGGYRWTDGSFGSIGDVGYWWSSTKDSSGDAWYRDMRHDYGGVLRDCGGNTYGFSMRCVREP